MGLKYANNAKTTLNGAHNDSTTTITVVDGSVFPTLGGGDYFYMTLEDVNLLNEVVKVTARSTNTLTVVRAQNGTTAKSFSTADKAEGRVVAAVLDDLFDITANVKAWLADPTSAKMLAAMSDKTGTGSLVFATSPTFVTPLLGTPTSGVLTNCTGLPVSTGISGLGTGVATALAVNAGSAGAFVTFNGALGTPASGVLTNCTGLPNASVVGLGTAALKNTGTSGDAVPLLNAGNLWGAARNQFAANSEVFALGVRYGTGTGSFWFGATNSATPDGIFSDTSGTEILRLLNGGGATLAGDRIMTRGANETVTGLKTFTSATSLSFARSAHDVWQVVQGTPGSTRGIGFYNNTDATYGWFVSDTENVGIGTTDPTFKMHVSGAGVPAAINSTNSNIYMLAWQTAGTTRGYIGADASYALYVGDASGSGRLSLTQAGSLTLGAYGAGTLVTNSSGVVSASSDEELKYIVGQFTRGLADLRAMDRPVSYQWRNEQIECAEAVDAISDTEERLVAAQASLTTAATAAEKEDATETDKEKHLAAERVVMQMSNLLADQQRRAALTREGTTYTGWTAQGVRKGIPEAVKAGPDGLLNFDERPVLAAMYNAILELATRLEALENAA